MGTLQRKDTVWQREDTVASYGLSRQGIPFVDVQFDLIARLLHAHGSTPTSILDLGCGDGIAAQAMIDRFPVQRAVLVDFSPPMLSLAEKRFHACSTDVLTIDGDLLASDWLPTVTTSAPYDLVISRYAIHHLPHPRKFSLYAEVFELLRPGGWFINLEHVQSVNDRYQRAFEDLLIDGIHRVAIDQRTRDDVERAFHQRQDAETNILAPAELQCGWLREIGFVDVDCLFKALELAVIAGRRP
jgi:ubiquinone/menaquinone biosynthesis C-methylase UbiE